MSPLFRSGLIAAAAVLVLDQASKLWLLNMFELGRRGAVAVTPVVSGVPITDEGEARRARSRAALLAVRGLPHTATAVATHYRDLLHTFVLDEHDADQAAAIEALGPAVVLAPTLLRPDAGPPRTDLARTLLALARPMPDHPHPSRR